MTLMTFGIQDWSNDMEEPPRETCTFKSQSETGGGWKYNKIHLGRASSHAERKTKWKRLKRGR